MDSLTVSFLNTTIGLAIQLLQTWITFLTTEQQKTQGQPFTSAQVGLRIQQLNRLKGNLTSLQGRLSNKPEAQEISDFNSILINVFKEDKALKLAYLAHRSSLLDKVTAIQTELEKCNQNLQKAIEENKSLKRQISEFSCPDPIVYPEIPQNREVVSSGGIKDDWWKYVLGLGFGITTTYIYLKSKEKV